MNWIPSWLWDPDVMGNGESNLSGFNKLTVASYDVTLVLDAPITYATYLVIYSQTLACNKP